MKWLSGVRIARLRGPGVSLVAGLLLGSGWALVMAQETPLTPISNLRSRTNASGYLLVAGPLTDAQLRASAFSVSVGPDTSGSGVLDALDEALTVIPGGRAAAVITVTGTWVGTLITEGEVSGDWATWTVVRGGASPTPITTTTTNGTFVTSIASLNQLRVRASAWTSGSATITIRASFAPVPNLIPLTVANTVTVDGSAVTQPVSGTVTVTATNLDVQIGGSDSLTIGTFPDNEPMNVAQFGGSAVVTGTGASGAGVPRVTVSNDSVVSTKTALTFNAPTAATVGVASAQALASNASRTGGIFINTSSNTISCAVGATAVLNSGITLSPWGVWNMDEYSFGTGAVNCIAGAAGSNLAIQELQ